MVQTITVTGTSYVTKEAYFNDFTGTGSHIAIKVAKPTSNYNYGYIDDIVLSVAPSCSPVNNLTVSNVAGSSAMISWEAGHFGTVSSYTLEYSEAGQESWIEASGNITGTSYILSGLEQLTSYDIRVKVNCDNSDESEWVVESFSTPCLAGGEMAIGNGTTTTSYFPSYSLYKYSYTQQIFLSSEMNGATAITSIAFDATSVPTPTRNIKIYLMHTTATSSSSWLTATNAVQVYSGTHTFTIGWNTFNLTAPFSYNGSDNLAVIVVDETGSYSSSNSFHSHTTTTNLSRYVYQDSSPYSVSSTPSSGTSTATRANVIFGGNCDSTATCFTPNMFVDNITTTSADVIWVPGYDENAWELEYTLFGDSTWTPVANVSGGTITIDQLTSNTHYSVRMRSDCGGGDYSTWTMTDFRTDCGIASIPFTEDFSSYGTGTNVYPSCWSKHNTYSTTTLYPYISTTNNPGSLGGSLYFYASASTYDIAVTPELNTDVNTLEVNFYLRAGSTSNGMIVGVMDSRTNFDSFVPVDTVFCSSTSVFQYQEVDLNDYTGNGRFVAFKSYNRRYR